MAYQPTASTGNETHEDRHDAPWIAELRSAVEIVVDTPLVRLTIEQRALLARYFAWRFSGYRVSQAKNRNAGARCAAAFATMAQARDFAGFTVRDVIDLAAIYRDKVAGGAPFYDPFAIRAVMGAVDS